MTTLPKAPSILIGFVLLFSGVLIAEGRNPELPLSQEEALKAAKEGELEQAFTLLREAAEAGDSDAAYGLGECYMTGMGIETSIPSALEWYERAAEGNQPLALLRLGEIYLRGIDGVEKDEDRARFQLQAAAEAGAAAAWSFLGQLNEIEAKAADAEPDRNRSFKLARDQYKKGAEAGHLECQYSYYRLLAGGHGGEKDIREAIKWLRQSALSGLAISMSELGTRLKEGDGVEKDEAAALGWFLAGAERGSPPAMTNLGLCYANGVGVPMNSNVAGSWYSKASKRNYAPAQYLIAQLFEAGRGTEKNAVFAYVNYSKAASSGLTAAIEARDALKETLSQEQLAEAEKLLEGPQKPKVED